MKREATALTGSVPQQGEGDVENEEKDDRDLEFRMASERADELGETGPWQRPGRREMQSYRHDTEIEEGRVALDLA